MLAGEGPYRSTVERLIREHGLDEQVLMLGQRNDVAALLKAADLFLFCSRTEGLPNALLEAMAAGLPVVATDVPGCRDLIVDGRTGRVVRPGDAAEIARRIKELSSDEVGRRRLGQAAQRWVRDKLNIAGWAQRWVDCYHQVLDEDATC